MAALLGWVVKLLVVIVLAIVWEFLKDLPLFRPSTGRFGPGDLPDLKRAYGRWERNSTVPILLLIAGGSWLAYEGFTAYVDYHYAQDPPPQFLIILPHLAWLGPAFGVGLVGAAFGWDLVLRWLLGDRYPDYHAYIDLKHGYNVRRASGIVAWVFVAAGIVLIPQMLRTHTAFYQDHMVVRRFLSLTDERIDYKQVVALNQVEQKKAPIGNWKNRPHHAITFADGTHWRSNALDNPDPIEDAQLFTFLGEATGLEVGRRRRLE